MNAPDFSLTDGNGVIHSLAEYKGSWLVLYFYPKDDTPGCTKEACAFRDSAKEFGERGVKIIGISKDSTRSHQKFANKYELPFTLLSDPTKETMRAYGAWGKKKFMGREFEGTLRNTYLINPDSKIVKIYERVDPLQHVPEILHDLESFM